MTYFYAVLDKDMNLLFNGTTEEVIAWLNDSLFINELKVVIGTTLEVVTAKEYLDDNS